MAEEKVKEAPQVKVPEQVKERYQPKKEGQSTFDKVLEQNRLLQKSPQNVQTALQKGTEQDTRVSRQQEQGERGKDKQSDEKEHERGKQKAREERKVGADTDYRILGKGSKKGSSDQGSGKGGHQDRGFGRAMDRKQVDLLKKGDFTKSAQVAAEASKFASQLQTKMKAAHLSREFIQNIVNQIIRYVKAGLNRDGDKEVRLDLNERIFRGLQLRVALKRGKVSVHFNTSNAEVRELFANSSANIQKELEAKGISVGEIKVT